MIQILSFQLPRGFIPREQSSVCIRNCYTWVQHNRKGVSKFIDILIGLSAFDGFVISVAVLIISAIKYKTS